MEHSLSHLSRDRSTAKLNVRQRGVRKSDLWRFLESQAVSVGEGVVGRVVASHGHLDAQLAPNSRAQGHAGTPAGQE